MGGGDPFQIAAAPIAAALFPAWAGVIPAAQRAVVAQFAFPRMGGGDPGLTCECVPHGIFSPHGRG